jgi:nuclear transport factor 2 (NTF2) superfamily protein
VLADGDLDDMLAEVDEKRKAISSQVRRAEDATENARRLKAARDSLADASSYEPVHAEWYEDPDAIQPHEFLTVGASPEQNRAAYMRHGAHFEADENGVLTLRLEIDLGGGGIVANRWHTHGNELWEFDENGLMKRRDASINDYKIEESERRFRWKR